MLTMTGHELVRSHTIYLCVVGSHAYGLTEAGSDTDRRGVFLAPTRLFWNLDKPPTHVDGPEPEQFSWELEHCCQLALHGNPTVLECLWSPMGEAVTDTGRELLALRGAFLSTRLARSYGGYAKDQFRRLGIARRKSEATKWNQAMHMLRLLLAGEHVLRTGEILVEIGEYREQLLAVKRGDWSWDEVRNWAAQLDIEMHAAAATSRLPAEPDRAAINDFLSRSRHGAL